MEKQLKDILNANMNIFNAVGRKISPLKRDEFPSVTYQRTSTEQDRDISGKPVGPKRSTFNITSRATTYSQAKEIAGYIESELDGKSGIFDNQKLLLSIQDDQSEDQLFDPDVVEVTLTYTFHHTAV